MAYAIGIDLGGSSVKAVAITTEGKVLQKVNEEFDAAQRLDFAETIREVFNHIQKQQGTAAHCFGVAAPGLASKDGTAIAFMPGRLHGLEGLNWTDYLGSGRKVPVLNDAHAALLGEGWIGVAKGMTNVIMLTLGTGVGGAAIVDGHLLRGHIGRAGHLGHNCLAMDAPPDVTGIPGSVEYFVGNYNIRERTDGRFPTTHALIEAARGGDANALEVWNGSIKALACSIAGFANILDPEGVIIGGGIARAGAFLFEPLEQMLRPIEWQPGGQQVKLLKAELGEYAGAIGCARNALEGCV